MSNDPGSKAGEGAGVGWTLGSGLASGALTAALAHATNEPCVTTRTVFKPTAEICHNFLNAPIDALYSIPVWVPYLIGAIVAGAVWLLVYGYHSWAGHGSSLPAIQQPPAAAPPEMADQPPPELGPHLTDDEKTRRPRGTFGQPT